MELGGNAPFLVLPDADIEDAVAGAMLAKMRNAGEACTAANRFYVHRAVVDDFSKMLSEAMAALRLGPGLDESSDVGPLINHTARLKVSELVEGAADWNARVLTGGTEPAGRGFFYEPTVLADVDPAAPILREEIFGPVAPIVPFDDLDTAVAMANDTEYGLISYVYAGEMSSALSVAEALDAGMVAVNRGLVSDPAAPFGGVKQSGLGREGAREGMLAFLETKYIGADW
jgi:succinate-semialdehyde dehydrogenase/glutarate-semialdehyde dehydrogenase